MKDEALKLALEALLRSRKAVAGDYDLASCAYGSNDPDGHRYQDAKKTVESVKEAITAIKQALAQPVQGPVGCAGAIVNGRVYADRLEHDYKFECEAGPLHLCNDWVEFRRCFEWLAVHTTPPNVATPLAAQRQSARSAWVGLTDEEVKHMLELFVIPPHHVEMVVRAIEAKLKEKNT